MNIEKALQKVCGFGIKEFIEKAMKGGYGDYGKPNGYGAYVKVILDSKGKRMGSYQHTVDEYGIWGDDGIEKTIHEILLDPLSWKAVSTVEFWGTRYKDSEGNPCYSTDKNDNPEFYAGEKMHQLIDTLAKDI